MLLPLQNTRQTKQRGQHTLATSLPCGWLEDAVVVLPVLTVFGAVTGWLLTGPNLVKTLLRPWSACDTSSIDGLKTVWGFAE